MYARRTALSMTSAIVKTVTGLLVKARDSVDERGFDVLNAAPIITKLMPNILASISSLAVVDPSSAVQVPFWFLLWAAAIAQVGRALQL